MEAEIYFGSEYTIAGDNPSVSATAFAEIG